MSRITSEKPIEEPEHEKPTPIESTETPSIKSSFWITPVKSDDVSDAKEVITRLVARERIYAFGEKTLGRKLIAPGDWICFYETTNGVIAHAQVMSKPERAPHSAVRQSERYPWVFSLNNSTLYFDNPVLINAELRSKLEAFEGRDLNRPWAWFVQSTHRVSEEDYKLLTRSTQ